MAEELTRPKPKRAPVYFRTEQAQGNHDELTVYLGIEGMSWNDWVLRREAAALPYFRTKYGRQRAQEEQR